MKIAGVEWQVDLGALALTLALGAVGGVLAHLAQLPLGYLLGSMVLVGVLAAFDIKPLGRRLTLPTRLRFSFVPVIGIAIGGAFTPEVARAALGWGPSLAALFLFVPVAHVMGYALYRRGGLARAEAYYSAIPGGLIESVQMDGHRLNGAAFPVDGVRRVGRAGAAAGGQKQAQVAARAAAGDAQTLGVDAMVLSMMSDVSDRPTHVLEDLGHRGLRLRHVIDGQDGVPPAQ